MPSVSVPAAKLPLTGEKSTPAAAEAACERVGKPRRCGCGALARTLRPAKVGRGQALNGIWRRPWRSQRRSCCGARRRRRRRRHVPQHLPRRKASGANPRCRIPACKGRRSAFAVQIRGAGCAAAGAPMHAFTGLRGRGHDDRRRGRDHGGSGGCLRVLYAARDSEEQQRGEDHDHDEGCLHSVAGWRRPRRLCRRATRFFWFPFRRSHNPRPNRRAQQRRCLQVVDGDGLRARRRRRRARDSGGRYDSRRRRRTQVRRRHHRLLLKPLLRRPLLRRPPLRRSHRRSGSSAERRVRVPAALPGTHTAQPRVKEGDWVPGRRWDFPHVWLALHVCSLGG